MPTRRVASDDSYLPTSGVGYGAVLIGAVVAEHLPGLDEDQRDMLPRLVAQARDGLTVPRIALRYRLQTDRHGLERSRHRILAEDGRLVLELDRHGRTAPQVIGAVMAAAALPSSGRGVAFRAIDDVLRKPALPEGLFVRRLYEGVPGLAPFAPGGAPSPTNGDDPWRGVPSERRWAMEVLGLRAGMDVERGDVQARFRRLVRLAHPDQGGATEGAAERLAELAEARELLLISVAASSGPAH
jgi:hypothetical protein